MDPNTQALLGGFQVGNQWAAQWARNKASEDDLKKSFGEDTVFDKKGKVDIVGSATKKKAREVIEAMESGKGFAAAWDGRQIPSEPVPTAPMVPDGLGRQPEVDFEVPADMPPDTAPRQNLPYQQSAEQISPWDAAESMPYRPSGPPVTPRNAVQNLALPDMTGWRPAQIKAFMDQYPKARENERQTQAEIAQEATRLLIAQQRSDDVAALIAGRDSTTDKNVQGRLTGIDKTVSGRLEGIDRTVAGAQGTP